MKAERSLDRGCALLLLVACAACTTLPAEQESPASSPSEKPAPVAAKPVTPPPKPKPATPAPKEVEPAPPSASPSKSVEELRRGVQRYDDGQYKEAARNFQTALELGLANAADQVVARKHLAFMACVARKVTACRNEFRKAFEADPLFDLTPAEAGHPMWGPVFRSVKTQFTKQRKPAAGGKAAPPPAR